MNARTVLLMMALSLGITACGNKGPLVQAPVPAHEAAPIGLPGEDATEEETGELLPAEPGFESEPDEAAEPEPSSDEADGPDVEDGDE
jgi:predicted small lipoprotein YifL